MVDALGCAGPKNAERNDSHAAANSDNERRRSHPIARFKLAANILCAPDMAFFIRRDLVDIVRPAHHVFSLSTMPSHSAPRVPVTITVTAVANPTFVT